MAGSDVVSSRGLAPMKDHEVVRLDFTDNGIETTCTEDPFIYSINVDISIEMQTT